MYKQFSKSICLIFIILFVLPCFVYSNLKFVESDLVIELKDGYY